MTYFGFLFVFLGIPILFLMWRHDRDNRVGKARPTWLNRWTPVSAILIHMVIALVYTTPWDNYLVATRVWWYDPALVTNIVIGWVPIEEYTFFLLQPILGGLWLWFLARRLKLNRPTERLRAGLRWWSTGLLGLLWVVMVIVFVAAWQPGTYLALELMWALPPIMLQLAFGADILWQNRKLVALSILPLSLYLSAADALAIGWGTWTINPAQSLDWHLLGVLPVEEFIFFLLTNVLITFGITLLWAEASHQRIAQLKKVIPFASWSVPGVDKA